jgi:hypothetical protein
MLATSSPASSLGNTLNMLGATRKVKNIRPPTQTTTHMRSTNLKVLSISKAFYRRFIL